MIKLFENFGEDVIDQLRDIWSELEDGFDITDFSVYSPKSLEYSEHSRNIKVVKFRIRLHNAELLLEVERLIKFTESILGLKFDRVRVSGFDDEGLSEWVDIFPIEGGFQGFTNYKSSYTDSHLSYPFIKKNIFFHLEFK